MLTIADLEAGYTDEQYMLLEALDACVRADAYRVKPAAKMVGQYCREDAIDTGCLVDAGGLASIDNY